MPKCRSLSGRTWVRLVYAGLRTQSTEKVAVNVFGILLEDETGRHERTTRTRSEEREDFVNGPRRKEKQAGW